MILCSYFLKLFLKIVFKNIDNTVLKINFNLSNLLLRQKDDILGIVRPEKFQFLEKGQNRNFDYKIVISVKNP